MFSGWLITVTPAGGDYQVLPPVRCLGERGAVREVVHRKLLGVLYIHAADYFRKRPRVFIPPRGGAAGKHYRQRQKCR